MEYIIVRFPDSREVFVDGMHMGRTSTRLRVEEGVHTINLGDPRNYTPKWRRPEVSGTTSNAPLEVYFDPA
jgi:hypothetical protein